MNRTQSLSTPRLIGLALLFLTLAIYWPVLHFDFVNYDDDKYVTANPHVLGGLKWDNVKWAFRSTHASNWHPGTWLSHALDCQLFGMWPGGHHLTNLLLHAANTLLLFLLLRLVTGAMWRSALKWLRARKGFSLEPAGRHPHISCSSIDHQAL
jgi:hypothetical protein